MPESCGSGDIEYEEELMEETITQEEKDCQAENLNKTALSGFIKMVMLSQMKVYEADPDVKKVMEMLENGTIDKT
jgi:hypothetical protein